MSKNRIHSKGKLIVHIILVSKYRKKILIRAIEKRLKLLIEEICKREKVLILAMEFDIDHIHILLEYPKNLSISYIVQKLKQETTYYIRKEFKCLNSFYYNKNILWNDGYFANSIGNVSVETAKNYIDNQG